MSPECLMSTIISKNKPFEIQLASILKNGIELIGLINNQGRMINSIGSMALNLPKDKKEMFLMKIALRNSMQTDFDEELGPVNYCLTQRGNKKYISIPIDGNKTILIVTEKDIDHEQVVVGIKQMLQHTQQFLGEKISGR